MNLLQRFKLDRAPVIPLKSALIAGVVLIVGVNAISLGLVAWNRSGEPEAVLTLSERELDRPYDWHGRRGENSGLALKLRWRVAPGPERIVDPKTVTPGSRPPPDEDDEYQPWAYGGPARWLDDARLARLGFVFDDNAARRGDIGRHVFLVMEYNGPAYQVALHRARQRVQRETALRDANPGKAEFEQRAIDAAKNLSGQETKASRLFVIDAGLDAAALRSQYPDRQRYALVTGQIRVSWCEGCINKERHARIAQIDANVVHVPNALHTAVPASAQNYGAPSGGKTNEHFTAEIAFGKRFEPWIRQATRSPPARL